MDLRTPKVLETIRYQIRLARPPYADPGVGPLGWVPGVGPWGESSTWRGSRIGPWGGVTYGAHFLKMFKSHPLTKS